MVFGKRKRDKASPQDAAIADIDTETTSTAVDATADASTAAVQNIDVTAAKGGLQKAEARMKRDAALEAKHPHMVPGSIRSVPRGERVGDTVSKGRVATITCMDCGSTRDVNLQDVFQVRRCVACAKANTQRKLEMRRGTLEAKKLEDSMSDDGVLP